MEIIHFPSVVQYILHDSVNSVVIPMPLHSAFSSIQSFSGGQLTSDCCYMLFISVNTSSTYYTGTDVYIITVYLRKLTFKTHDAKIGLQLFGVII